MTESFLFNVADRVLGKLGSHSLQEASLSWGLESELKKLDRTLSNIKAVLLDAEEKQARSHELRVWLERLKDILYDGEDVLDEFECEALRTQVVKRGSITRKVGRFFSLSNIPLAFRLQMRHKIKEIRERLDEIAADKTKFHLTELVADRRVVLVSERDITQYSFVQGSYAIGRDHDKETIVELLMLPSGVGNVSIIPIVGVGGLGKTTLVKYVYNDERVIRHFELKIWVYVSWVFDVTMLIDEILGYATSATDINYSDLSMDQLPTLLRETLDDRKFLIVLDDVWNEDRKKWKDLGDLLMGGAGGSKIIVTTRSHSVASIMGTIPTYNLEGLPHEDCLSVFKKWAFPEGQAEQYQNLMKIGNGIVKKCGGLPLAVRTLGSLLYGKTDEHSWLFIRDNEVWKLEEKENDIIPALRLSYDIMPSHLKPCFAYCSIFSKDYEYDSLDLIRFWMAHGLIQSSNENEELEDIGLRYFKELWSRSFFQDVADFGFFFTCKMHGLIHELGLSILQKEYSTVNFHTQGTFENVRHLLFSDTDLPGQEVPGFMNKLTSVRTVSFIYKGVGPTSRSFVDTCISKFKYLRVLDLRHSIFEVLPSSIGTLKHLRYLDLSWNIGIKKLPHSFCKLQNLQHLGLVDCEEIEELPRNIRNMISLRSLDITTKQKCLPENGIGCLNSLRDLSFYRCCNLEYLFEGMQHFTSLRTLVIVSCTSLISLPLRYLTALDNLVIRDCEKLNLVEGEDNQGLVGLSLRTLSILELPQLVALPQWLQGSADTLQYLRIIRCGNFTALPQWLPNFISLRKLMITGCPNLLCLPEGTNRLAALRELRVRNCPTLSERCQQEIGDDWLKIAHVPVIYLDGTMITQPSISSLGGSEEVCSH